MLILGIVSASCLLNAQQNWKADYKLISEKRNASKTRTLLQNVFFSSLNLFQYFDNARVIPNYN